MTVLTDALDYLRENGWKQGHLVTDTGACLRGACLVTQSEANTEEFGKRLLLWEGTRPQALAEAYAILADVILEQYPDRRSVFVRLKGMGGDAGHITVFNDHAQTTFEDVERVLEKAIVREQEKEAQA